MFTGIIETLGRVVSLEKEGTNTRFKISSPLGPELKIDQSLSHNGVCLTVVKTDGNFHWVVAVEETLQKSNLGRLEEDDEVNLERCMLNNGRFDGHIVQGHVDQTGTVSAVQEMDGSWLYDFAYDASTGNATVEKGSIAVNGVSLTCFNSTETGFRVAIIPYTYEHTNFHTLKPGNNVNLEFDIVGKYIKRFMKG